MTANVSFYLIVLPLHVKCHSLQERNVPENVLIVDLKMVLIFLVTKVFQKGTKFR